MQFIDHLNDNLDNLEIYHFLEDEMSKYKTLNHENIKWDKVYEYSLEILQRFSMDARICNHFVLSCIALDNEKHFKIMSELFRFLVDILQRSPEKLGKNTDIFNMQKKKIKSIVENLIMEANKLNLSYSRQIVADLNHTFLILGKVLECNFKEILITSKVQENEVILPTNKQVKLHTQSSNIDGTDIVSLNDREYRLFFNHLAFKLLENDRENINAYAIFVEAMWGRISALPTHIETITQINCPDKNLIQILLQSNGDELEHIKCFMSNLALNPFWIEGLKFFCEFLHKYKKTNAYELVKALTRDFLVKFKDISNLKFSNGKPMCESHILNYFLKQNNIKFNHTNHTESKINKNKRSDDINEILLDINTKNNDSLSSQINAMIEIANLFEEKNMQNNAKILYIQIKDLMEKTFLKDYLLEDYVKIKAKSEKI